MRDVRVARWDEVGDKGVRLAEAVPEAVYDARLAGVVPPASRVGGVPGEP